jgi:hypothetical protein
MPTGIGISGYTGGVDYIYLTYDTSINYDGVVTTTDTPVDVEILSWPTTFTAPINFEAFDSSNDVYGILGVGGSDGGGPTTSPIESAGYSGALVDVPDKELVLGTNTEPSVATVSGDPISNLYETVTTGGTTTGSAISDDVDDGGVYGTIPSSLANSSGTLASGSVVDVYSSQGGTLLYTYTVGTDSLGNSTAPTAVSGTGIDSGVEPFLKEPIYVDYANDTTTFDKPGS